MSRRAVVALVLVVVVIAGAVWTVRSRHGKLRPFIAAAAPLDTLRAPANVRVRVEVLNTTRTRGLARRAMRILRAHGFDVVYMGTTGPTVDTTLALDRSGHPAWAATVAQVLGSKARHEARPDSSRYLDVTVLLGTSWRPPAEALDP